MAIEVGDIVQGIGSREVLIGPMTVRSIMAGWKNGKVIVETNWASDGDIMDGVFYEDELVAAPPSTDLDRGLPTAQDVLGILNLPQHALRNCLEKDR